MSWQPQEVHTRSWTRITNHPGSEGQGWSEAGEQEARCRELTTEKGLEIKEPGRRERPFLNPGGRLCGLGDAGSYPVSPGFTKECCDLTQVWVGHTDCWGNQGRAGWGTPERPRRPCQPRHPRGQKLRAFGRPLPPRPTLGGCMHPCELRVSPARDNQVTKHRTDIP